MKVSMSHHRIKNLILEKSFIVGSISFFQGKKKAQELQHKWTVYVRGVENEDMGYYISKVQFTLHDSFAKPVRSECFVSCFVRVRVSHVASSFRSASGVILAPFEWPQALLS